MRWQRWILTGSLSVAAIGTVVTCAERTEGRSQSRKSLPRQISRFDGNNDGRLSSSELPQRLRTQLLKRYDRNEDASLDVGELKAFAQDRKAGTQKTNKGDNSRVMTIRDIRYTDQSNNSDRFGKLDLYLPRHRTRFPVLFWIHGGGLHSGDKSKTADVAKTFARHGFGVVSVNYRLSPAVKFPAHVEDVATAFAWMHSHIQDYGGDRDRLFVTGGSAGGHLAILLTLDQRYLNAQGLSSDNIRGAIPISALMDVSGAGTARLNAVWDNNPATQRMASPLSYVREDAPPILIMYADGDTPDRIRQNRTMYAALLDAGHKELKIKELKDRTHTTVRPHLAKEGDPGLLAMLQFMKKYETQAR